MKCKMKLLILALFFSSAYCSAPKQLKGVIEGPKHLKNLPDFAIFHKGLQTYSDSNGLFTLPDRKEEVRSILICRNFNAKFAKKNTVEGMQINRKKPYKYFVQKLEDNVFFWKEQTLQNDFVPENAVIIRMNPKLVETVKEWEVILPDGVTKLPKVILFSRVTEGEIKKSSNKSLLYSLDQKPFHERVKIASKEFNDQNKKVTLMQ